MVAGAAGPLQLPVDVDHVETVGERGMAWTFLPDGTAHDAAGHHVGTGFAWEIKQRGITADAYLGETYPDAGFGFSFRSFCPITDGTVLTWDGGSQVGVDGARVAHELWAALLAAKNAPPPAPAAGADSGGVRQGEGGARCADRRDWGGSAARDIRNAKVAGAGRPMRQALPRERPGARRPTSVGPM